MRYRGAMVGLCLFMVVAVTLTWLVYVTLRRDVGGPTAPYAAVFSDVFGLREGDDVRMAGVRVGRVEKIELQGDLAVTSGDGYSHGCKPTGPRTRTIGAPRAWTAAARPDRSRGRPDTCPCRRR